MKKSILAAVGAVLLLAAGYGLYYAHMMGYHLLPQKIVGELKVLTYAPQGNEIPISTDGITVMFNKGVVPLTTLDSGRDRRVPLKITPKVDGKFFWLGTHGFIFRPASPLDPATKYKVEMPAGLVSVDGYRLDQPLTWEFGTVAPRSLMWEPADNSMLLPKNANFFLRFNIAMDTGDVEKKLSFTDAATGQLVLAKRNYIWGDDGHTLVVQFKDGLPWDSSFKVTLPQGVKAKKGDIGTAEPVTVNYSTPSKKMELTKVYTYDLEGNETAFQPGKETTVRIEGGVCYAFTQAIDKKSFEKAFLIEATQEKPRPSGSASPYYYFLEQESDNVLDEKSPDHLREVVGYKTGCATFLDDYNATYHFSIDPKKIESLSGAPLETGGETYIAKTGHADPELRSLLTKNILSQKGPMKIPYRGMNLKSVSLRLYRWPNKDLYDETIRGEELTEETEEKADNPNTPAPPPGPATATLGVGGHIRVPLDTATHTIDQTRMPADATTIIPVAMKPDESTHFAIDLAEQKLAPGIYLMEAVGNPNSGNRQPDKNGKPQPGGVYSMIQVSPIGIAIKREVDHVLVWATDIESGAPVASLPLRVTLKKWDSTQGVNQTLSEGNVVTNQLGVAIWNQPSNEEVHACVEVTQPGSESYSCESDHKLTDYRHTLKSGPHYFAYLYTDRPIYRPGQKVYYSSFIRQVLEGRYFQMKDQTPAVLTIADADGQEVFKDDKVLIGKDGVVHGEYQLNDSDDLPRGQYSLTIAIEGQKFTKNFSVASYRKPSFKVDLKPESPEIVSGDKLKVDVQGSYFFGAPMRKAATAWSIMTSTYIFSPEGYQDYSFIDDDLLYQKGGGDEDEGEGGYASDYEYDIVSRSFGTYSPSSSEDEGQWDNPAADNAKTSPGGFFQDPDKKQKMNRLPDTLNDEGHLQIAYTPNLKKYPTSQILTVEANVEDPSHQEVSGSEDVIVHKGQFYLGVKPDKWSYGTKDTLKLDVVSLDTKGKPSGSKSFKVDVVRRDYKFIERRTAAGYWEFVYSPEDTKITTLSGKTDGSGKGEVAYQIPQGGTFRLVAKGSDANGNDIQSATTVYAWGEGYVPWRLDKPEKIELVPDKTSYKVGDTAKILVKSLVPVTKALATLERGRLLEYKVIDLGGNASHIEIPITEGMIPNLYLSVVAHVGRGSAASGGTDHPPLLYYGETEIAVEPEQKRLNVSITPDRKGEGDQPPVYRPGDEVKVHLETKDASGQPKKAHVMVSVADESVLRLLNYQLPDLVKKFYYRRPNGVATSSSLFSLKAGDSGTGGAKKRRIFKDTAHFEAHIITNDQGQADFSFKLPDDLTTWVIEALAITDSKSTEAFEAERQQAIGIRPPGQTQLQSDLVLTDNTFVGGNRGKIMTTLPVVMRPALPRFAVWGDALKGAVILNNRNAQPVDGKVTVTVSGDATLEDGKASRDIDFSIAGNAEKTLPVPITVGSVASGQLTLSINAKDKNGQGLDSLEVSLPVKDRFAPEVVATSGMTDGEEKEQIDLSSGTVKDKGGLDVSLKASLALATAPSLRSLINYPWGCSEQKSASMLAMLMARQMSEKFGESYFDKLAPIDPKIIEKTKGLDAKLKLLDDKINDIAHELSTKYVHASGGMKYWPESEDPNYFASVQVLWALTRAKSQGYTVDDAVRQNLKNYIRNQMAAPVADRGQTTEQLSADDRAYGLWALTLDNTGEFNATEEVLRDAATLTSTGLAYGVMAIKNSGNVPDATTLSGRLLSLAQQEPRHMSWPATGYFWATPVKNTALAGLALLTLNPDDPNVPRALAFLLNRKKTREEVVTQDALYLSTLLNEYAKIAKEDQTNFKTTVSAGTKTLIEKSFDKANLLATEDQKIPMKDVLDQKMPIDMKFSKSGTGRLYYDMVLKYYLPPDKTPTREEGLIVSREYYALDDVKELKPLTEFKAGENYKGHITIVAPQEMNYILVQDLLPAGFEPVDMTLSTTSKAEGLQAAEAPAEDEEAPDAGGNERYLGYDDIVTTADYGMDYAFAHQEIRDDAIIWSSETLPPGVYHIRYPVRATTAGIFLMPGATASEFYEPEIFGRSRGRVIEIEQAKK